jgi:succinate dehydrogenase flavin-adding protein (antitoxin of CptAB toxin-antitoxin module)
MLRVGLTLLLLAIITVVAGMHYIHTHIPKEIIPDIRAAISARGLTDPDARFKKYMESRYGSMDDPAHREHAFEDYFNRDHIKAMQLIVKHSPPDQRRANIRASANWLANYRQTMSPQEKADLADYFQSDQGREALQAATAQFMNQDAEYRSSTTPVINQLMTTLSTVKQ